MKLFLLALLLAPALARDGGENRLWLVDLELVGPLEGIWLEGDTLGETFLRGRLLAGEERRLEVAFPGRSPLGEAGLGAEPLPTVRLAEGASGQARVLGWSAGQPVRALAGLSPGLRSRPRPPTAPSTPGASLAALAGLFGLGLLGFGSRRGARALPLGVVGALALALLTARGPAAPAGVRVLDLELAPAAGGELRLEAALGELGLDGLAALEVEPAGRPLRFVLELGEGSRPTGVALAPGRALVGLARDSAAAGSELSRTRNGRGRFESVWLRDPSGGWSAHGAWPEGSPLPPARAALPGPPGWLAGGLPPGTGVLLAALHGEPGAPRAFLRATGFEASEGGFPERD